MVGQPTRTTPRYSCVILTSDPETGVIEVNLKGDMRRVQVVSTAIAWRWPVVGETWIVRQENGTWYLDSPYAQTGLTTTIATIQPGDAVINSPTGKVYVLGSTDGSTDFSFNAKSWPTVGSATLIAGTVTVPTAVITAASKIFLTPQDNNTTGALRVSARTPGVSFVITSSLGTDHGLVAYQIWG